MGDAEDRDAFLYDSFPEGFKFGLATSAYQIEGGWNLDGNNNNTYWHVNRASFLYFCAAKRATGKRPYRTSYCGT